MLIGQHTPSMYGERFTHANLKCITGRWSEVAECTTNLKKPISRHMYCGKAYLDSFLSSTLTDLFVLSLVSSGGLRTTCSCKAIEHEEDHVGK